MRFYLKIYGLLLFIATQIFLLAVWLRIRFMGSATFAFDHEGPRWVLWMEEWIEPIVILCFVILSIWMFFQERHPKNMDETRTSQY